MKRTKTGIKDLDDLIEGGFPPGDAILLTGAAGTGKSILGGQYIYEGARMNEPGVYVSFEQSPEELLAQWRQFFKGVDRLIKKEKIRILNPDPVREAFSSLKETEKAVEETQARRLVIDSLTTIAVYSTVPEVFMKHFCRNFDLKEPPQVSDAAVRMVVKSLVNCIKGWDCTSLLISEAPEEKLTVDGISEFSCDGVIKLDHIILGDKARRTLTVVKLRQTKHEEIPYNFEITAKGIAVKPLKEEM